MRINIIENWNVKSKKDKSRENISIPYAYVVDGGKTAKRKLNLQNNSKSMLKKVRSLLFTTDAIFLSLRVFVQVLKLNLMVQA